MQLASIKFQALGLFVCTFTLLFGFSQSKPMASSNPVVVLVPGAWLTTVQYTQLTASLHSSGFKTVVHRLPSVNSKNPDDHTVTTDASSIRQHSLLPEIGAGRDVVLLMHSYGGIPGPVAANGLSKQELSAQGKPGGIIGMIMLSAFIARQGQALLDKLIKRQYSDWVLQFNDTKQLGVADPSYRFYNDLPEARAEELSKGVGLQSQKSFDSPAGAPAWADNTIYNNRRVFLKTMLDHAIPPQGQTAFMASSGVVWNVQEIQASHCAFVSQPKAIAAAVIAAAAAFQGVGFLERNTTANLTTA